MEHMEHCPRARKIPGHAGAEANEYSGLGTGLPCRILADRGYVGKWFHAKALRREDLAPEAKPHLNLKTVRVTQGRGLSTASPLEPYLRALAPLREPKNPTPPRIGQPPQLTPKLAP